jgi:hypothetical protein
MSTSGNVSVQNANLSSQLLMRTATGAADVEASTTDYALFMN